MATTPTNPLASGDTAALYRAAIGPRGQDYYLRHFTRFDAEGKAGTSWNWAAYWSTFNWLIYRKMGARALAYLGTLLGLALLVFGLGKVVLDYSDASAILLGLLMLTGAFVVPGLYGNAWFHAHCNRRITEALRNTKNLQEAADLLAKSASHPKGLMNIGLVNAALIALVFGAVQWLQTPEGNLADLAPPGASGAPAAEASAGKASGRVTDASPADANKTDASAPAAAPATSEPSAPTAQASSAPASTTPATAAPTPAPSAPAPVTSTASSSPAAPIPAPAPTVRANDPALVPAADKPAPTPATPAPSPSKPAASSAPAAPAPTPAPAVAPATNATAAPAPATPAPTPRVRFVWVIQVGAYAQEENAQRALAQVQSLGLEAGAERFSTSQGSLMRVRVGPFTRQAEAEQAAVRIKSLDLPVLLLRQRP